MALEEKVLSNVRNTGASQNQCPKINIILASRFAVGFALAKKAQRLLGGPLEDFCILKLPDFGFHQEAGLLEG